MDDLGKLFWGTLQKPTKSKTRTQLSRWTVRWIMRMFFLYVLNLQKEGP